MKTPSLIAAFIALAACTTPENIHTLHVSSTLELPAAEKCEDVFPSMSTVFPVEAYVCERPSALVLMHLEVKCAGATKFTHEAWELAWSRAVEVPPNLVPSATKPGYWAPLYQVDEAGGIAPADNDAVRYASEDGALVARYDISTGAEITERIALKSVDEEEIRLGNCISSSGWGGW
jgi:hypothetical protein